MTFVAPTALAKSFTCPHCGVIAQQKFTMQSMQGGVANGGNKANPLRIGQCQHCNEYTVWLVDEMLYPFSGVAPRPNSQMPTPVLKLYEEAAAIFVRSPRSAAALLRLAIQVLCIELGEKGNNINQDIASLVKKGLPEIVQQSLDVVRVTGNEAVHPGQIDTDDPNVVGSLFELTNIVVEYMIAMPNRVSGLFGTLPPSARNAITKRDTP